jgi:hypothetical protein
MKNWQHGYEINHLKSLEALYQKYNSFTASPFAAYKKNNIAEDLHNGKLITDQEGSYVMHVASKRSPITLYQNVLVGYKEVGDQIITRLRGTDEFLETFFNEHCADFSGGTWVYVWAEDTHTRSFIEKQFYYVGSKITTFGEIYSIYFKDDPSALAPRSHPYLDPVEKIAIKQLTVDVNTDIINSIKLKLEQLNIKFQNHYSNYNKKKSWSAISLRGYTPDIMRIEKPVEMSKKWKEEHKDEQFDLQDTYLREQFPEIDELLSFLGDGELHRIRFMRLVPGGGELTRHTDQVDPDSGLNLNNLCRLHFPIQTNPEVSFGVWDTDGIKREVNMKVGDCWVLDTRKPHTVINLGTEDRVHLVVDVKVTPKLKELILL